MGAENRAFSGRYIHLTKMCGSTIYVDSINIISIGPGHNGGTGLLLGPCGMAVEVKESPKEIADRVEGDLEGA
tara:strand:- start:18 stop:236 length:219 start_codon:yes stop_codon:yes gene_type:complete